MSSANSRFAVDFIHFKTIGMSQLLHNPAPSLNYGGLSSQNKNIAQSSELLYKVFKGDTKLVRSLLEANNFQHTEGHDWNLLWSSGNCKQYLYEGLNEWQKINHFPQSYELTRKDRLAINVRRMQSKFGKEAFGFIPDTYVIPNEYSSFVTQLNYDKK